ncbi:MAG: class I SAM-dependent methyltransferase [Lachnospiraceae bacterium]|nr:class I SAM-dependent methyltransferase [Lachnospiraceae bacterium]
MDRIETIGKVKLNLSCYSGEDLYSDGDAVENHILDIVKCGSGWDYCHPDYASWPVLYHLTRQRENICLPMELRPGDEVLEIGAGMGAVTGGVAPFVRKVDCIELSKRRSLVNAYRHRELDNIEIFVGNYKDIRLDRQYDVVTLIGVLEYACYYVGGEHPYEDFLKKISGNLKEGGRLYIAIENKLGMKYFAGCHEDHLGRPFAGIEGYKTGDHVRTFSRSELISLLERTGYKAERFFYPFPDYKLPTSILGEEAVENGEIDYPEFHNYDLDVLSLFSQNRAFAGLKGTKERAIFANSFLVEAVKGAEGFQRSSEPVYIKCSDERTRNFAITTTIERRGEEKRVVKEAVWPEGSGHLRNVCAYASLLRGAYPEVLPCPAHMEGDRLVFRFLKGRSLLERLADTVVRGDKGGAAKLLLLQKKLLKGNGENETEFAATPEFAAWFGPAEAYEGQKAFKVSNFDGTAGNIFFDGEQAFFIDYEWVFDFPLPQDLLLYHCLRDAYYHLEGLEELLPLGELLQIAGIRTPQKILQKSYEAFFGHVVSDEKGESFAIAKHSALKKHYGVRGPAPEAGTAEEAWRASGEAIKALNSKIDRLNQELLSQKKKYAELDEAWFRRWDEVRTEAAAVRGVREDLGRQLSHLTEAYHLMEKDRDIWKANFETVTGARSYKAMEKMRKVLTGK